ncbi:MAG: S8 family serine peptidase [Acidobacteriota bacterium]
MADAEDGGLAERQLLVRLAPEPAAPSPEVLIESARARQPLTGALATGEPLAVDFLLKQRASGSMRAELAVEPERPRARLHRWIVLTYPAAADLAQIERALWTDPGIEAVQRNLRGTFSSVTPDDPLFSSQWGSGSLDLPEAWERTKGHGFVGLIDTGLDVDHPDLAMTFDSLEFKGGNFRPHLSKDFAHPTTCATNPGCVDEDEPGDPTAFSGKGHGTHVSGIVGATADNATGVAGNCWNCSLMMARSTITTAQVADALRWLADHGAQTVSMSFGWPTVQPAIADAIDDVNERDLIVVAAVGNDLEDIEFPAFDDAVIAAGGTEEPIPPATVEFWQRDVCPSAQGPLLLCDGTTFTYSGTTECGSNYTVTPGSSMIELVAPAAEVLSTFYLGGCWNRGLGCHDDDHPDDGYDYCTGTSMSSPSIASVATLVRSVNPLLSQADVRSILQATASGGGMWDPQLGYGVPNTPAAVDEILGRAAGQTLANRLTPLFVLYSSLTEAHLETTVPQRASAAIVAGDQYDADSSLAPAIGGYAEYPGLPCIIGPCFRTPVAWVYLFSTDREPFPGSPDLTPLYRLSREQALPGNPDNQSFAYAADTVEVKQLTDLGFQLDGIEGYLYEPCTPEPSCVPAGATRLYRMEHTIRDDYVVVPLSKVGDFQTQGYGFPVGFDDWIGYVYENLDADGDFLIDGFEALIGTDGADFDSDDDGLSDGQEILQYPYSDPLDTVAGCNQVFADSFDSGDFSNWDSTTVLGNASLAVTSSSAMEGPFGMQVGVQGVGDRAFARDQSPAGESIYRARFLFRFDTKMNNGGLHRILALQDASPAANVVLVRMRKSAGQFQLRADTRLNDGSWSTTPWVTVAEKTPIEIEVLWRRGNILGPAGSLDFTVDGLTHTIPLLDNWSYAIDRAFLGLVNGVDAGTDGTYDFDAFESCRD